MIPRFFRAAGRLSAPLGRLVAGRRFLTVWAAIEYQGRKTGRRYRVPLAVRRTPEGFLFPIAFGARTQWPRNVLAAGGCTVRWNGRTIVVGDPQILTAAAAVPAFNAFERPILRLIRTDRFLFVRAAPPA